MRMGMGGSWLWAVVLEQLDRLTLGEADDRLLGRGFLGGPVLEAPELALADLRADADDLDLVDLLDRGLDLVLGRGAVHEEAVLAALVHPERALFREDRLLDDVVGFHHAFSFAAPMGSSLADLPVWDQGPASQVSSSPLPITRYRWLSSSKQLSWSARQRQTPSTFRAERRTFAALSPSTGRATRAERKSTRL